MNDSSTNNLLINNSIQRSERELQDLEKFWNDISWWERDESIQSAREGIGTFSFLPLTPDQKTKVDTIRSTIETLKNMNSRPWRIRRWLNLTPKENFKPNYRICIDIIMSSSTEDLLSLGKYLGISDIELLSGNKSELTNLLINLGKSTSTSTAMFYAYRNYLGKMVKGGY